MSWLRIARKDYRDAMRERSLYVYVGLFAVAGLALGYFLGRSAARSGGGAGMAGDAVVGFLGLLLTFLVPIAALGLTQDSIVGKRAGGELKVLLGLPFSRRDVLVGTFVGRSAVVLTGVLAITVTTLVPAVLQGASVGIVRYVAVTVLVGVLGLAFVAVAVSISSMTRSQTWSAIAAFGVFLVLVFPVWDLFPTGVVYLLNGFSMPARTPEWAIAFRHLDPITAFGNVVSGLFPDLREFVSAVGLRSGDTALYERAWFGGSVVCLWILVPLMVGFQRFQSSDL